MARKRIAYLFVGTVAVGALLATTLPLLADDSGSRTVVAVADTTATQVVQDGDNGVKTTLATCPQLCDGNPRGWRDAVVRFTVTGLPATAGNIRARLRLHAWTATAARVAVFPSSSAADGPGVVAVRPDLRVPATAVRDDVVRGFNEWDVSVAVTGNGDYTFTLRQETHNSRVYWASRENRRSEIRPELTITYDGSGGLPSPTASPIPSAALPSRPAPPSASTSPRPTTTAPSRPAPTGGPSTSPTAGPTVPGWRLAWSDEFSGSGLDTRKWTARDSWVDYDRACITSRDNNVFVRDGMLTLRAHREGYSCGSERRAYTTAYLDTRGKASFTYGRFEIRAKSPNTPTGSTGLWPAFWMRPDDGGVGEIDVVELPGGANWYKGATQAIFYDYTPIKQDNRSNLPNGYPGDGFHTYTTEWEPGVLRWYIDGREVYKRDRTTTSWFDKAFSRPFHLRINFQVGGWLGDPDAATRLPADFQVDYVRVWRR
ncbi:family 16 glycosylhydrolase [Plantactinospora sp. GCM10030261]|uniref:family 16 glycosylhydrolase n=1 Tax=Plantactinospora sp. GCM10030261 TaxID=3273420 RepID=UPI003618E5A3